MNECKKITLAALVIIAVCSNTYSEEITYIATQKSHLRTTVQSDGIVAYVKEGETLSFQGRITTNFDAFELLVRNSRGQEGWIDARHVILQGSLLLSASVTERVWVPSHYQRFCMPGAEKEDMFNYEPLWRDEYDILTMDYLAPDPWWGFAGGTSFIIRDNLVRIRGIPISDVVYFATAFQWHDAGTVTLDVLCEGMTNSVPNSRLNRRLSVGGTYRLTLRIDGDYMDVFVDGDVEAIASLVGVNSYFAESVRDFFYDDKAIDLSRIIWPRRADGSTDFPPPEGVTFWADVAEKTKEPESGGQATEADQVLQAESDTENNSNANSVPARALITVTGAAVLVAGGIILFAVKRKKAKA